MYDAFISYSRANLPLVQSLKQMLDEHSLRVFLDLDSLRAGQDWPPQLGGAVQDSRMFVLCWSAQAAESEWVRSEINHSLSTNKPVPVLPWLLDSTPLPAILRQTQGIRGTDPAPVVNEVAAARRRHRRRFSAALVAGAALLVPALWFAPRFLRQETLAFQGHVIDEQGNPVTGAVVEAAGVSRETSTGGRFQLVLPETPPAGELRVTVRKNGFKSRTIDTRSDIPDLGVVLEKDR